MYRITIYHRHDTTRLQVNQRQVRDRFQIFGIVYVLTLPGMQQRYESQQWRDQGSYEVFHKGNGDVPT